MLRVDPDHADPFLMVVIPTHNRWEEARISLTQLAQSGYRNFEVVLIDDGSIDGTVENCRREFPDVKILHGNGDLWWSGAINMGIRYALSRGARGIVWLNDDNRVEHRTIGSLVTSFIRQGEHSIVCARVKPLGSDGREWAGDPPLWHRDCKNWRSLNLAAAKELSIKHPPCGQGVLIPAECFRHVGLIDSGAFPHYWADYDFHYRAMKAGYTYFIATDAVVWNVPNKERPNARPSSSLRGIWWFLLDRSSPMNMIAVRRLLKRHLTLHEFRETFYPLLWQHLIWLASGWTAGYPALHRLLRAVKKTFFFNKAAQGFDWP